MVRDNVSKPQTLPVTSVMVYVPGWLNCTFNVLLPVVQSPGFVGCPFALPNVPLVTVYVPGEMLHRFLGSVQVGA